MPNYSINTLKRNLSAAQNHQSLTGSAKAYPRQVCSLLEFLFGCFGISKHYAEQDFAKEKGVAVLRTSVRSAPLLSDLRTKAPCKQYKESAPFLIEDDKGENFLVKLREIPNDDGTKRIEVVSDTKGRPDYGDVIYTQNNLNFFQITGAPE